MRSFSYFIRNENYFWTLEEDGDVIAIRGGDTIAYSEFVIRMLEDLADQGLPPFGSLLLAIIATNQSTNDLVGQVQTLTRRSINGEIQGHTENRLNVLDETVRFLNLLASLPVKYTTGKMRVQLFQLLFADCHGKLSKEVSRQIVSGINQLKETGNQKVLRTLSGEDKMGGVNIYEEFRCIALLLRKFPDTKTLIDKLAGIPEIEEPVLEEEKEKAVPGDFIESLMDHPTTFPVGALVRSLWSGMSIPIHHSLPSAQPMGGFSDLSNKGDLDKLLVSEFAGDDWMFLSRLANNEALYLHRETPPGADQMERIILIDVTLKSWGTPKVLAYAILLAIAKHPKTDIHCTAYAVGNDLYPVAVDTVDEVIQSIQMVDGALHPAAGLIKFFERSPAGKTEVFFIAPEDSMRHPAIQKVISDHYSSFKYWVTVSQEGKIIFYRNQHKGRKLIQQLNLPLDKLWEQGKRRRRPEPADTGELPQDKLPVPILFPPPKSAKKFFISSDLDLFAVTKERNLFRHRQGEMKGWELVFDEVQSGASLFAMGPNENGRQLFLCFKTHNRELTVYQLDTGESKSALFNEWAPSSFADFFFFTGAFHYIRDGYVWRITYEQELNIEKMEIFSAQRVSDHYHELQGEAMKGKAGIPLNWSVLKNIHHIFINQQGNLVFNKHELVLSQAGHIQLLSAARESRSIAASSEWNSARNEFTFPGGSKIRVLRSGMIVLLRSGRDGSVYIPAVLDVSLAAATETHFAGNLYYYPTVQNEPLIKISTQEFYKENIRPFIQDILQCS
jgi:hypothetical protein